MSRLEWDRMLDTGDPDIDAAHRGLFEIFNDLRELAVEGGPQDAGEVLDRLTRYLSTHFAQEQDLMIRTGYPPEDVMRHLEAHEDLARQVREMAERQARGELATLIPPAALLHAWLREHIRMVGRRLAAHVRERRDAAERRAASA